MSRRASLLTLVFAGLFLLTAGAAANGQVWNPAYEREYQAALDWWGVDSPPGCLSVDRRVVPSKQLQLVSEDKGHARGEATLPPPAVVVPCNLRISSSLRQCEVPTVMLHEVGHLLGHGHGEGIMSESSPSWFCEIPHWKEEVRVSKFLLQKERLRCRDAGSERRVSGECGRSLAVLRADRTYAVRELRKTLRAAYGLSRAGFRGSVRQ